MRNNRVKATALQDFLLKCVQLGERALLYLCAEYAMRNFKKQTSQEGGGGGKRLCVSVCEMSVCTYDKIPFRGFRDHKTTAIGHSFCYSFEKYLFQISTYSLSTSLSYIWVVWLDISLIHQICIFSALTLAQWYLPDHTIAALYKKNPSIRLSCFDPFLSRTPALWLKRFTTVSIINCALKLCARWSPLHSAEARCLWWEWFGK